MNINYEITRLKICCNYCSNWYNYFDKSTFNWANKPNFFYNFYLVWISNFFFHFLCDIEALKRDESVKHNKVCKVCDKSSLTQSFAISISIDRSAKRYSIYSNQLFPQIWSKKNEQQKCSSQLSKLYLISFRIVYK